MDDAIYSRLQLIRLSGAPEDAVRFWIREHLLQGPDRGERRHFRFSKTEVKIAAFLREARSIGLNVGAMRALVAKVREGLALYFRFDAKLDRSAMEYAWDIYRGEDPVDVMAGYSAQLPPLPARYLADFSVAEREAKVASRAKHNQERPSKDEIMARAIAMARDFPFDHADLYYLGQGFFEAADVMTAWLDNAGEWQCKNGHPQDGSLPASSVIAFDWSRVCAIDWSLAGVP